jgi:uncharacterized membrane protein YfcA
VTDPWLYPLLVLAGVVAGALNVIAGGGSFLTLPILIFMGLPASVANGTNRVGIFFQNVGAVWGFHRNRLMDWKSILWAALPASLGAIAGTILALSIGDAAFRQVLAFLMIAVTLWTLWDPLAKKDPSSRAGSVRLPFLAFGFFLTGVYGGFVQAGVGFLVLAATTMAGLDLVRGNAVKVLSILAFTIVSLAIFVSQGKVLWLPGLVLALGTFLGGQLGVRFTVLKGHAWVKRVVTVTIIVFAVKLWVAG